MAAAGRIEGAAPDRHRVLGRDRDLHRDLHGRRVHDRLLGAEVPGRAGRDPLRVEVTAQQFLWSFKYQNKDTEGVTSPILYLPRDESVKLTLIALDVIHSFWVPEFGQKQDAVPGTMQHLVITPTKD